MAVAAGRFHWSLLVSVIGRCCQLFHHSPVAVAAASFHNWCLLPVTWYCCSFLWLIAVACRHFRRLLIAVCSLPVIDWSMPIAHSCCWWLNGPRISLSLIMFAMARRLWPLSPVNAVADATGNGIYYVWLRISRCLFIINYFCDFC